MSVSILPKSRQKQKRYALCTLVAFRSEATKKVYVSFTRSSNIRKFHYSLIASSKQRMTAGKKPSTLDLFLTLYQTEPLILSSGVKPHERQDAIRAYEIRLEVLGYTVVKRASMKRHSVPVWEI